MKILISGYYGFGNVGDEAVLQGALDGLREIDPKIQITALSGDPAKTEQHFHVHAIPRNSMTSILPAISDCDVFISGGGTLFQDATSFRSILYYLSLIQVALWMRKRVVVFAQGFGPVGSSLTRYLLKNVLQKVHLILLRDPQAEEEMKNMGIQAPPIHITGDPAYILKASPKEEVQTLLRREGIIPDGRPMAAICVRKFMRSLLEEQKEQVRTAIAKTADFLVGERGMRVVFVNFQPRTDVEEAIQILNRMKHPADVILREYLPGELLGFLGEVDLVIGMRLHSLIFATRMGVPCVGLAYDPKVTAFVEQLGQTAYPVDTLNAGNLLVAVQKVLEEKNNIRQLLESKQDEFMESARSNFHLLNAFFQNVHSHNVAS